MTCVWVLYYAYISLHAALHTSIFLPKKPLIRFFQRKTIQPKKKIYEFENGLACQMESFYCMSLNNSPFKIARPGESATDNHAILSLTAFISYFPRGCLLSVLFFSPLSETSDSVNVVLIAWGWKYSNGRKQLQKPKAGSKGSVIGGRWYGKNNSWTMCKRFFDG